MVKMKRPRSIVSNQHEMTMYFLNIMLIDAATKRTPVNTTVNPPPGIIEVSIPLKKSTTKKWFTPITPKGMAKRIRAMVVCNELFVFMLVGFR